MLVFDECAVPSHPNLPEPTFRLKDGGDVFFVYLLNEIAARGGEITGEIANQHPAEIAQNRAVEASGNWVPLLGLREPPKTAHRGEGAGTFIP